MDVRAVILSIAGAIAVVYGFVTDDSTYVMAGFAVFGIEPVIRSTNGVKRSSKGSKSPAKAPA